MAPRVDRRKVLRAAVALGVAASLPACGPSNRRHIVGGIVDDDVAIGHWLRDGVREFRELPQQSVPLLICGGGVAGLAAAWRLRHGGYQEDIPIFELGSALGGTSRADFRGAVPHPFGAHYLPLPSKHQRALVAFLNDLGWVEGFDGEGRVIVPIEHRVRAPAERLWYAGVWQEGLWPEMVQLPQDLDSLRRFEKALLECGAPDEVGLPFTLPLARCSPGRRALDSVSAEAWLGERRLVGRFFRWWLEYGTQDDYGSGVDEVSAFALLHYHLARRSPGSEESAEFLTWPEGNGRLVHELRNQSRASVHTRHLVTAVRPGNPVEVDIVDATSHTRWTVRANQAILACPQYVVRRLLNEDPAREARASFRYAPWVVMNLHVDRLPSGVGFPPAWDNVVHGRPGIGYVDAGHQVDRPERATVLTWYLPFPGSDEAGTRRWMLERSFDQWRDHVLDALRPAHPDLEERVHRIDVWRWGHAMVKPVPGFLFGPARAAAATSFGNVHFANADTAGLPLFEEAHWAGTRAAEEVLIGLGLATESLL